MQAGSDVKPPRSGRSRMASLPAPESPPLPSTDGSLLSSRPPLPRLPLHIRVPAHPGCAARWGGARRLARQGRERLRARRRWASLQEVYGLARRVEDWEWESGAITAMGIDCCSAASSARPPRHPRSFMAAGTFNRCHTPPGLPTSRSSRQTDASVFPVSVPGLSASLESSRRRPSSTKSTTSRPCFVSGGAASQRPPLHRALLDPTASFKAQSAAALLRPPTGGRRRYERCLLKLSARLRPRPRPDPPDPHRHAKSRSRLTPLRLLLCAARE